MYIHFQKKSLMRLNLITNDVIFINIFLIVFYLILLSYLIPVFSFRMKG